MAPPLRSKDGRWYFLDGVQYPSVTTVLGEVMPKPWLAAWTAREVAAAAFQKRRVLMHLDHDEAVDLLRSAAFKKRDRAADRGTELHEMFEKVLSGEKPKTPEAKAVAAWLEKTEFQPEFLECTVFHTVDPLYAGTADAIGKIGDVRLIVDFKTGQQVYPEACLQIAAYAAADVAVLPDGERVEVPEVQRGMIVHLRPEDDGFVCDSYLFELDDLPGMFMAGVRWFEWLKAGILSGRVDVPCLNPKETLTTQPC